MIRFAICDDSVAFLEQAKFMIEHWDDRPQPVAVELFGDGDALIKAHTKKPFDIILLDIVMPLLNGIEVAKEIREEDKAVKIVFLTTSPDFAVESYTVKASNYLLKPVNPTSLFTCLEELVKQIQNTEKYISIKNFDVIHRVRLSDIEYVEADNKHAVLVCKDGRRFPSQEPLYAYEDKLQLKDGFFKCHRSYIVNVHCVGSFSHKEIRLQSGRRVPISRRSQKDFEDAYFSQLFWKAGERV